MPNSDIIIAGSPRSFIYVDEPIIHAASVIEALPPDKWIEIDNRELGSPVRDQKIYPTCAGFSSVTAYDIISRRKGTVPPLLSGTYPFVISNNDSHGARLSVVMDNFQNHGTCPNEYCPVNLVRRDNLPEEAQVKATFKPEEASVARLMSVEEIGTALSQKAVVVTISPIGPGLNNLDAHGIIPLPERKLGYHAWCAIGLSKLPAGVVSRLPWMFLVQSSWGEQWGVNGYGFLLAEHFDALNRPVTAYSLWPGRQNGV